MVVDNKTKNEHKTRNFNKKLRDSVFSWLLENKLYEFR